MDCKGMKQWGLGFVDCIDHVEYLACHTRNADVRVYKSGTIEVVHEGNRYVLHHISLTQVKGLLGTVVLLEVEDWCKEKGYVIDYLTPVSFYIPELALEFSYVTTNGLLFVNNRGSQDLRYWSTTFCLARTIQEILTYMDKVSSK